MGDLDRGLEEVVLVDGLAASADGVAPRVVRVAALVAGLSEGRLGLWARELARSFATSRAEVGLELPLLVVVLDEVEVVVWEVDMVVALCLAM